MTVTTLPPATHGDSAAGPAPKRPNRLVSTVIGLILVAGAVAAQPFVPTHDELIAPLTHTGGMGETVDAARFSARALSVKAARAVEVPDSDTFRRIPTEQVFLIVETSATATKKSMLLAASLLSGDDKVYEATDKVGRSLTLADVQVHPGWWTTGVFVFEVPAEALPGARLVVHLPQSAIVESYAPEAEIDLGLDEDSARSLVARAAEVHRLETRAEA